PRGRALARAPGDRRGPGLRDGRRPQARGMIARPGIGPSSRRAEEGVRRLLREWHTSWARQSAPSNRVVVRSGVPRAHLGYAGIVGYPANEHPHPPRGSPPRPRSPHRAPSAFSAALRGLWETSVSKGGGPAEAPRLRNNGGPETL